MHQSLREQDQAHRCGCVNAVLRPRLNKSNQIGSANLVWTKCIVRLRSAFVLAVRCKSLPDSGALPLRSALIALHTGMNRPIDGDEASIALRKCGPIHEAKSGRVSAPDVAARRPVIVHPKGCTSLAKARSHRPNALCHSQRSRGPPTAIVREACKTRWTLWCLYVQRRTWLACNELLVDAPPRELTANRSE